MTTRAQLFNVEGLLQAILTRTSPMQFFSYSVVFIGIIEETFKYLPFVLVVLGFKAFDERIDGIVLAGLCHGLFNYLTFSSTLRFLSALLILVIWAWGIRILEKRDGRFGKPSHPGVNGC